MKALTNYFNMRMRITGLNDLIVEESRSAAQSMQPQCAVDRARVQHRARHIEVSLNRLTMIDILNYSSRLELTFVIIFTKLLKILCLQSEIIVRRGR